MFYISGRDTEDEFYEACNLVQAGVQCRFELVRRLVSEHFATWGEGDSHQQGMRPSCLLSQAFSLLLWSSLQTKRTMHLSIQFYSKSG